MFSYFSSPPHSFTWFDCYKFLIYTNQYLKYYKNYNRNNLLIRINCYTHIFVYYFYISVSSVQQRLSSCSLLKCGRVCRHHFRWDLHDSSCFPKWRVQCHRLANGHDRHHHPLPQGFLGWVCVHPSGPTRLPPTTHLWDRGLVSRRLDYQVYHFLLHEIESLSEA